MTKSFKEFLDEVLVLSKRSNETIDAVREIENYIHINPMDVPLFYIDGEPVAKVAVSPFSGNMIYIDEINVITRNRGDGKRIMQIICDIADKYGQTLKLAAIPQEPLDRSNEKISKSDLIKFYKSFGFVQNNNPVSNGSSMVREPMTSR